MQASAQPLYGDTFPGGDQGGVYVPLCVGDCCGYRVPTWGDQVNHCSMVILIWGCARVTSVTYPRQTGGEPLVKGDDCFGREFE